MEIHYPTMNPREELFAAIHKGDKATVERLVSEDRTLVNAQDAQGQSAVLTAAYHQKSGNCCAAGQTSPQTQSVRCLRDR